MSAPSAERRPTSNDRSACDADSLLGPAAQVTAVGTSRESLQFAFVLPAFLRALRARLRVLRVNAFDFVCSLTGINAAIPLKTHQIHFLTVISNCNIHITHCN